MFSAITVFFVMLFGIRMIPYGMRYLAESRSAIKKIQDLLLIPKYDNNIPTNNTFNVAVLLKNASFVWDNVEEEQLETSKLFLIFNKKKNFFRTKKYYFI